MSTPLVQILLHFLLTKHCSAAYEDEKYYSTIKCSARPISDKSRNSSASSSDKPFSCAKQGQRVARNAKYSVKTKIGHEALEKNIGGHKIINIS